MRSTASARATSQLSVAKQAPCQLLEPLLPLWQMSSQALQQWVSQSFEQAEQQATARQAAILLQLQCELPSFSPMAALASMPDSAAPVVCFRDSEQAMHYVGSGIACQHILPTEQRWPAIQHAWQERLSHTHSCALPGATLQVTPCAVFAVAFAERSAAEQASHWQPFGGGLLRWPEQLLWANPPSQRYGWLGQQLVAPTGATAAQQQLVWQQLERLRQWPWPTAPSPSASQQSPSMPLPTLQACDGDFAERFQQAMSAIEQQDLAKLVLARYSTMLAGNGQRFAYGPTLQQLAAKYEQATIVGLQQGDTALVVASPEHLLRLQGLELRTHALAGTSIAKPSSSTGQALLRSTKDRYEHGMVVQALHQQLAQLAREVTIDAAPKPLITGQLTHLVLHLRATLLAPANVLQLAQQLHPTPAVGAWPPAPGLAWLAEHEQFDRGLYGGPCGWLDNHGHGQVVVAIRSACLRPSQVWCYGGAGLVRGSKLAHETAEIAHKMQQICGGLVLERVGERLVDADAL